jgi:hypothetical protein
MGMRNLGEHPHQPRNHQYSIGLIGAENGARNAASLQQPIERPRARHPSFLTFAPQRSHDSQQKHQKSEPKFDRFHLRKPSETLKIEIGTREENKNERMRVLAKKRAIRHQM